MVEAQVATMTLVNFIFGITNLTQLLLFCGSAFKHSKGLIVV
jgi:hypothetical protein